MRRRTLIKGRVRIAVVVQRLERQAASRRQGRACSHRSRNSWCHRSGRDGHPERRSGRQTDVICVGLGLRLGKGFQQCVASHRDLGARADARTLRRIDRHDGHRAVQCQSQPGADTDRLRIGLGHRSRDDLQAPDGLTADLTHADAVADRGIGESADIHDRDGDTRSDSAEAGADRGRRVDAVCRRVDLEFSPRLIDARALVDMSVHGGRIVDHDDLCAERECTQLSGDRLAGRVLRERGVDNDVVAGPRAGRDGGAAADMSIGIAIDRDDRHRGAKCYRPAGDRAGCYAEGQLIGGNDVDAAPARYNRVRVHVGGRALLGRRVADGILRGVVRGVSANR